MKKIMVIIAGVLLLLVIILNSGDEPVTRIGRPDYNASAESHSLILKQDGKESEIEIVVNPKEIPEDRLQEAFDGAYEEVLMSILGENSDFKNITANLELVSQISKYGIKADYFSDNTEVLDSYGNVYNRGISTPVGVKLYVDLSYRDMCQRYEIPLTIQPVELTEEEQLHEQLNNLINSQGAEADYVEMPDNINGKKISFAKKGTNPGVIILLVAAVGGVLLYKVKVGKPKKDDELRKKQMMSDYSEIVSKLSLLMGAGMSSYNALSKMVEDYRHLKSTGYMKERYAYEELTVCVNRIMAGTSETQAYKEMGRRCGVHAYIKLCSFLSQNINKGNANIFDLLREETREAFEERKAIARRNGEEAGTKLLGPMVMMLTVVLVIVIVPAFMSL